MWKAWFIITWLSILTGKLIYFTRKAVDAYHTETEYLKHRYIAEATVTFIMIIIYILAGLWIITTFPD